MKFPGVLKKEHLKIPGFNQKRSGIYRGVHEGLMLNFHGSRFFALEFTRGVKQFYRVSRGESLITLEFLKVK